MADYPFLVFSFLCAFLNLGPTISHITNGNSGPACFGIWVVVLNTFAFVNAVIWRNDAINRYPALCDISSKVNLVGHVGLLTANLCVIRYMARLLTPHRALADKASKRRRMIFDYALCFGMPTAMGATSVVYQVARFGITKTVGCNTVAALSWPTYLLFLVWPPIICGIACGYAIFTVFCLVMHRRNLRDLIANSGTPLNTSRLVRLGGLAATYLCISTPFMVIGSIGGIQAIGPYVPFTSWSALHNPDNTYHDVRLNPIPTRAPADRWLAIAAGMTLFVFFSFAQESLVFYGKLARLTHVDKMFPSLKRDRRSPACLPAPGTQITLKPTRWDTTSKSSRPRSFDDLSLADVSVPPSIAHSGVRVDVRRGETIV